MSGMNVNVAPQHSTRVPIRIELGGRSIAFSSDLLLDVTFVLWFCGMPLRVLLSKLLRYMGMVQMNRPVAGAIIFLPLLLYILINKRLPWKYFHWVFFACALFFDGTLLLNPSYLPWYTRPDYSVMYTALSPDHGAVWAFLMVEIACRTGRLWKDLKWMAGGLGLYGLYRLRTALQVGYWSAYSASGEMMEKSYSLDFGYDMIFVALVLLVCFLSSKHVLALLACAGCCLLALQYGSRGAFLCVVAFIVLYLLNGSQANWKKAVYVTALVVMAWLFYQNGEAWLQSAAGYLIQRGVSSRTLQLLVNGGLMDISVREEIYLLAENAIRAKPIFGYGAYGDRPIIGPQYYWGYCHNLIYEILINFGVVLGTGILLVIVWKTVQVIQREENRERLLVFLIVVSMCMRLLVSDTFWGNRFFWMLLAMAFAIRRKPSPRARTGDRGETIQ